MISQDYPDSTTSPFVNGDPISTMPIDDGNRPPKKPILNRKGRRREKALKEKHRVPRR